MADEITDPCDPRLVDYRNLRDVVARRRIEADQFFIAEGPVAIERLLASDHRVRSVLLSRQKHERMAQLFADRPDVVVYVVDKALLRELVGFDLHRGAIAAADRRPHLSIDQLAATSPRIAILEGLNDPENLGLIARSARALGVDGLVLDPTCIDPYTRRTVRVSMGEILHLSVARGSGDDWPGAAFDALRANGHEIWALTPADDASDIWSLDVPPKWALCCGAEGPGLQHSTIASADRRVVVPIDPEVDSLNVAAAAAVAFAIVGRR